MSLPLFHFDFDDRINALESLLKIFSQEWRLHVLVLACGGPIEIDSLTRQLNGAGRDAIARSLHELVTAGLLLKCHGIPLAINCKYELSPKGEQFLFMLHTVLITTND